MTDYLESLLNDLEAKAKLVDKERRLPVFGNNMAVRTDSILRLIQTVRRYREALVEIYAHLKTSGTGESTIICRELIKSVDPDFKEPPQSSAGKEGE